MIPQHGKAWKMIEEAINEAQELYPEEFTEIKVFNMCYYIHMAFRNPERRKPLNTGDPGATSQWENRGFPPRQASRL